MLAAMKRTAALSLIFVVGCVAGATTAQLVVPKARAGTNPQRWEYHCVESSGFNKDSAPTLNARGAEGWELVSASHRARASLSEQHDVLFCFKRPLG
jgi:hypothetical protein